MIERGKIERGKHSESAERQSLRGFAPQHVKLMSKDEVLGLQRSPRPEDFVDLALQG